ncbi:sensor histidine kinase [Deminuibacter soli]|uniref:histidine kinase n=1 Tax=Deminuibacter soli TaxID=2291815 RepID=A0A3E1NLC8_9BACT|nr:HAMP domain-containing sensor histidine kinase [Deminuibacter soli]RFM28701.1 sensor histidine kinase [Deminuibacter soli]
MIQTLKKAIFKYAYLLITAAWLYTISFIFTHYWSYTASPSKAQQTLENYLQQQEAFFNNLKSDTSALTSLFKDAPSVPKQNLVNQPIGIFGYEVNDRNNPIQVYWNSFTMSVNTANLSAHDGVYTVNYQNGFFELLKYSFTRDNKRYILAGLIPIHWSYFFENKYLKKEFAGFPGIDNLYGISDVSGLPIRNLDGNVVYYLQKKPGGTFERSDNFSLIVRVLSILFLIAFVNALAHETTKREGFAKGFGFLVGIIFVVRLLTYMLPVSINFRNDIELFDPAIYASNSLHPSLGDLLINAVLFFWVVVFYKFHSPLVTELNSRLPAKWQKPFAVTSLLLLIPITFQLTQVVTSLVSDSKISFDVTNFFNLSIYTFISFVVLSFIVIAYYHLAFLLVLPAMKAGIEFSQQMIIVAVTGLILLSFNLIDHFSIEMKCLVLLWLLLFIALLGTRKKDALMPMMRSGFFLFWVIFFSVTVSALIIIKNKSVELEQRKKIAEQLASQTDPAGEILLSVAITNFTDDFLSANFNRFKTEYSNKFIKDSLINKNFTGYLNKYDTHIYVFDSTGRPMYNDDNIPYYVIKQIIASQGKATSIPDLYYYESSSDLFSYLYEKRITAHDSITLGHLFVIAKPKRYKSEALFPELFKQVKDISSDLNTDYAYAVYSKSKLINNFNNYPFPSELAPSLMPKTEFELRKANENSELWYNAGNNKVVLIVKKSVWFKESITLFAYLFCVLLAVIMLYHFSTFLLRAGFKWRRTKELFNLNIRTQIHTTIIFISIFSFVVIAIATISFFIVRFRRNNEERLTKAIQVMNAEVQSITNKLIVDDGISIDQLGAPGGELERKIIEISEIHNVDVNMYNASGDLTVSTQPYIYNKRILSDKMEPRAFYALHYNKFISYIQEEKGANFSFLSIYLSVKDQSGNLYAYLNIPYLNSQSELNQEISNFLVTLVSLMAFIFVFAGAIALLLTNRITASFTLIGDKMKQISLGKTNEEIVWSRNDEIGALVNEYNIMVQKLEESAQGLARSEREGAWREMARQVAHEIKNPLTPMKLSIQYLQRAIDSNAPNVKQLSQQMANTLVEQIDQLSKIAGDFSQFANISNVALEKFDLNDVLASLINLYSADADLSIRWIRSETHDEIYADKVQINRLFTNLIKNAIEASAGHDPIEITIEQYRHQQEVVVGITDNGTGISPDMQQKIFAPNFTTKSSGTGLGLAICKGIVEKANGHIWFETREGAGSTFFVSLPLA